VSIDQRPAFLNDACGGDEDLRREIESLLANPESADAFFDQLQFSGKRQLPEAVGLTGRQIGPYKVLSCIDVGGMGEVYRAHDTKLNRDIALKMLPAAFMSDPMRVARFTREALVLASLNHPNIGAIYGLEESDHGPALVLELVEGPTLADRIRQGPMALTDALPIARQIAEALEAAHEQGIIHRDLKPANIKVGPDGTAKVLDFGLAKLAETTVHNSTAALANSPGLTSPAMTTGVGVLLGTAAYMSPEQAKGRPADKKSDIWAFGCVLYEMLTGVATFLGENVSDTLAAVLRDEPDWRQVPPETPERIRILLKRCLQKDPRQRIHDVADVRLEIADADADSSSQPSLSHTSVSTAVIAVLTLVSGAALASAFWWAGTRSSRETPPAIHLNLILANYVSPYSHMNASREVAISPDGRKLVYVGYHNGRSQLYLRTLDESAGRPIDGTEGATTAFFSTDSRWIAFDGVLKLQKVALSGGSPVTICPFTSMFLGGDWGADDTMVFVQDYNAGLWTVSASGGTPRPLLETDFGKDRVSYNDPQILPNGKGVLFTLASGHAVTADDQDVAVLESGTKDPRVLIRGGSHPRYLRSGHIVYVHGGALLAIAFDASQLAVKGTPVVVVEGIGKTLHGDTNYSISENGTLIYQASTGIKTGNLFVSVDRAGHVQPLWDKRGNYAEFSISPNGRSLATRLLAVNDDIWTFDVATGAPLRLTFEPLDEIFPQWTADGRRIAFGTRTGAIFWQSADGSGAREELTRGSYPRYPTSFSKDGTRLAFVEVHPSRRRDIWLMPLNGDKRAEPLIATDADERGGKISPDGRWIAYISNETGRSEVFVRSIDPRGGRRQVSSDGGTNPAWSPTGHELFFANGGSLVAVPLDAQATPTARERVLFSAPRFEDLQTEPGDPVFDVMPDGEHFVFVLQRSSSETPFNVVLNWFNELKARMPAEE
jgi:serine/threonine-protein kinase